MTEMDKLDAALTDMRLTHERLKTENGGDMIIAYGGVTGMKYRFDAICNDMSYGGKQGLIEVMGKWLLDNNDVLGWLTADEVVELVQKVKRQHRNATQKQRKANT